ncbi:MAG: tetratricopeptide repeat protein [Anaerolineae bacterium]|nr:MAG: tetratricopeptide repeat protein [Anaerolineae bacterium]
MEILSPQQLAAEGKRHYQQGDYGAAAESFHRAQEASRGAGQPLDAAEMANNRSVALLQNGDAAGALAAVEGTPAVFERGGERLKLAMAWGNRAAALDALGRLPDAETDYLKAADLLRELGEDSLHADVMKSLSALQLRSGRQLEALATMQAGVEGLKKPGPAQRLLKRLLSLPQKFLKPR